MDFLAKKILSFHAAAILLGAAALATKLLALFRDRLLAARFGAGETLDVYYAAFQIPDLLYTALLVGGASAAVMPIFLEYHRRDTAEGERFVGNLLAIYAVLALAAIGAAFVFAPRLVPFVVPGFGQEALAATVSFTRLILVAVLPLGVAGILSAVLQARQRFLAFALPPIFYNLGIIAGVLFLVPFLGPRGLAAGVLLGAVGEVLVLFPALRAISFRFRLALNFRESGFLKVLKVSLPRVLALSMGQVTLVALAAIASFFASGSISIFRLASNLLYVPVGLFGVSAAMAMFPKLSGASLGGDGKAFAGEVALGIRAVLFWALPSAALAIVLRAHIVRVVLGSGAFDWEDTRLVAASLAILAVAIVSESVLPLVLRAFYALGETRRPLLWDIAGSAVAIVAAIACSWFFTAEPAALSSLATVLRIGDLAPPRILAVALGFTAGSLVNVAFLSLALRRTVRLRFGIRLSIGKGSLALMLGAAVLAAVAAYVALKPFPALVSTNTLPGIALQGFVSGAVGLFVYWALLYFQKNPELLGFLESIRQRLVLPAGLPRVFETEKVNGEGH